MKKSTSAFACSVAISGAAILLTGCAQSAQSMRQNIDACEAQGLRPLVTQNSWTGRFMIVSCVPDDMGLIEVSL